MKSFVYARCILRMSPSRTRPPSSPHIDKFTLFRDNAGKVKKTYSSSFIRDDDISYFVSISRSDGVCHTLRLLKNAFPMSSVLPKTNTS